MASQLARPTTGVLTPPLSATRHTWPTTPPTPPSPSPSFQAGCAHPHPPLRAPPPLSRYPSRTLTAASSKTLLTERYLYSFGTRATVKKWKPRRQPNKQETQHTQEGEAHREEEEVENSLNQPIPTTPPPVQAENWLCPSSLPRNYELPNLFSADTIRATHPSSFPPSPDTNRAGAPLKFSLLDTSHTDSPFTTQPRPTSSKENTTSNEARANANIPPSGSTRSRATLGRMEIPPARRTPPKVL